jgi:hypothetical protein
MTVHSPLRESRFIWRRLNRMDNVQPARLGALEPLLRSGEAKEAGRASAGAQRTTRASQASRPLDDRLSPAHSMQEQLGEARRPESHEAHRRWSPRATLAFCGGISLILWGALVLTALRLR